MFDLTLFVIVFFAGMTQTFAGFGLALVAMPLLTAAGWSVAFNAPFVALVGLTTAPIIILSNRQGFTLAHMWRLSLASFLTVPLGVLLLKELDATLVTRLLGGIVIAYALWRWLDLQTPAMSDARWAYGLGAMAGLLGGAYNIAGPPAIIYANGRRWPKREFKANLQVFALVNSIIITLSHQQVGHYTTEVLGSYVLALPVILAGIVAGTLLDRYVDNALFGRLVLALLVLTGLRLLL